MRAMKIGFWFDYDQTWTFTRLFAELARRAPGLTGCGFVINDRYWRDAVDNMPAGAGLVKFYEHYNRGLNSKPSPESLARFRVFDEKRKLSRIAYSDRHLQQFSHEQIIAVNVYLMELFERFLDDEKPDAFIFNCVASQFAHLLYELLIQRGIKVVIPFSYGVDDLMYLADNPFLHSEDIWRTCRAMEAGADQPSAEEGALAEAFMAKIRAQQPAYQNIAIAIEQRKLKLPSLPQGARFLKNYFRYYRNDPSQPGIMQRLRRVLELRGNIRKSSRYLSTRAQALSAPFIYFPLHYEPEVTTLVIAPCDHASVIDLMARRMPISWRLVVKDHPAMLSQRAPEFYAGLIDRYPNLIVVDAGVPSLELIQKCELLVTLSGTAALEAAVLGKPVLQQSESRFGGFGIIPRMIDLFKFDEELETALRNPPQPERVRLMLAAIFRHCRQFLFAEPLGTPAVLEPANIKAIADAVQQRLRLA